MDNSKNIEGRKQARLRGIALATVAFVSAATGTAVAQAAPQVISQPGTISDKAADEKFVQATKSDDKRASKPKVISQPGTVSETQQESNADVVEETTQKETEKPQAKVISQPGVIVREGGDEGAGNVISQPGTTKVQENETPKPERDEREPQNEAPKPERDEREPQNEAPKYNDSQVREPRYVQVDDTKNSVVKPVTNGNAAANNVSQGQAASTKQNEAELTTRDTARAATATKKPVTEATDKADQAATATKKPVTEATDKADADEEATVIELGLAGEGEGGVTVTEDEAGTATKGQWSTPINAGDIDTTITHPDQDGIVTATDEATGKEMAWDASVSIAADDAVDNVAQAAGLGGEKKTPVQEATEVLPSESAVNVGGVEVQTEVSQQQSEAVQAETAQPVTEDTTDEAVQAETAQPVTEDTTDEAVQAETDTDSGVESASETTE